MANDIESRVQAALDLTGIPCTQFPAVGTADRYFAWSHTSATLTGYASNASRRVRHLVTINLFSFDAPLESEIIGILKVLKRAGFTPQTWGPVVYETDTRRYHVPMTVSVNETIEWEV